MLVQLKKLLYRFRERKNVDKDTKRRDILPYSFFFAGIFFCIRWWQCGGAEWGWNSERCDARRRSPVPFQNPARGEHGPGKGFPAPRCSERRTGDGSTAVTWRRALTFLHRRGRQKPGPDRRLCSAAAHHQHEHDPIHSLLVVFLAASTVFCFFERQRCLLFFSVKETTFVSKAMSSFRS
jgi:hypothetical protein